MLALSVSPKSHPSVPFCPSAWGDRSPQFSPDGNKVIFASRRSGDNEIWVCKTDGSSPTQLTSFGGAFVGSPRWSPDSQRVAFDYSAGGPADVMVTSLEQVRPLRVTSGGSDHVRPSWSNDGKWIYFASNASREWQVWKVPSEGGAAMQVTQHGGFESSESADGRFLYYVKLDVPGIWKIPLQGGEETRIVDKGQPGLWAVLARGLYFIDLSPPGGPAVEFFDFTTQRRTQVVALPKDTRIDTVNPAFAVSPDARSILYGNGQVEDFGSNIMVVDNFR
jgi:Tol biopolymer transport system component